MPENTEKFKLKEQQPYVIKEDLNLLKDRRKS